MRVTSAGPALVKLHIGQDPHKVSHLVYFACAHAHCLLRFAFLGGVLPSFRLQHLTPPFTGWGAAIPAHRVEEKQTALLTTARNHEGALHAPHL